MYANDVEYAGEHAYEHATKEYFQVECPLDFGDPTSLYHLA